MKKLLIYLMLSPIFLLAQTESENIRLKDQAKMQWFQEAKLGIFIHWGIYAVNGISESWSFFNGYISHKDYLKQLDGFSAQNYDPNYWAELIKESGAKYAVITSKHHDGFALWKTKLGNLNVVKHAAVKKDVLSPFINALKNQDLKVGIYYSLPDWSYDDYTHHTKKVKRYAIKDDPKRWNKFLNYYQGQLKELRNNFNPDLWWFDGDWEHNAEEWEIEKTKSILQKNNLNVIFNSRLCGNGDYETPEIGVPIMRPTAKYWELCMTMNDNWGYQQNDKNYKSPQQVIDIFVDCISKGGNLLLDIGPKADGSIPDEQIEILKELGKWTSKHAEAIYETQRGIPYEHFYGPTSLSKDRSILYLYVRDKPIDGKVVLKGISNNINRVYVVGNGSILNKKVFSKIYWSAYPGITYIEIPAEAMDEHYTVLAVVLDGKIKLYRERSTAIESN